MLQLFSKRKQQETQKEKGFEYAELPGPLKYQVIHICNGAAQNFPHVFFHGRDSFYVGVHQSLCRNLGLPFLFRDARSAEEAVWTYFLNENDAGKCLDVIEAVLDHMVKIVRGDSWVNSGMGYEIQGATDEINARFKENYIGYELQEGRFIRIDSSFLHSEIMAPSLVVLREPYLQGANQEFSRANDHFRHRRFPECMNECLKAFESTMKSICDKRGWTYNQNATANVLLDVCKNNNLFPTYMETSLAGLRSVLVNVATMRNRLSGHGQGSQQIQITEETAAFVLRST